MLMETLKQAEAGARPVEALHLAAALTSTFHKSASGIQVQAYAWQSCAL